jgi:glycosyltransferase involved in cell wall biosynthesis
MDKMKVDFVKYNRDRLSQYRTETTIWSSSEGRWVEKRALSEEGMAHIRNFTAGVEIMQKRLTGANLPRMVSIKDGVRLDFIEGTFLEDIFLQKAMRDDQDGVIEIIGRYRTYLDSLGTYEGMEGMKGVVADLLSRVPDVPPTDMMPVANIDLTFDNVIIDREGRYWIIDHEWVFDSPVPRSFILYRSLYVLYLKHERRIGPVISFPEVLMEAGVEERLWEPYREACERFIDLVFGKDRAHVVHPGYRKETHQLASLAHLQSREQQLYATKLELDATKTALDEMMVHAKLRLDQMHDQEKKLGELSSELIEHKTLLAERDGLLGTLRVDLESERLRTSALHNELEKERDHTYRLIKELEGERTYTQQMKDELQVSQNDMAIAREAMVRQDNEIAEHKKAVSALIKERDETFVRLQDMTDRFVGKQAELMTMSDWARSMQVRLEFMESVPAIGRLERMAKMQKMAVDKLKSDGLFATFKNVALQMAPAKVQSMFYRSEPSNLEAVEADVVGRDVLVVFPVIPWEFRWQRPQQLVSRFADNGYTVLFVHMDLTPKGSRYINDSESLKDVALGKLREHIFEVRLQSFGKLNVYQDCIRGADLNNIAHGLLSVLRRLEPRSVTYLVQFPGWGQLADLVRSRVPGTLVFDCMDDHAGFSNNATEVVKRETQLMEKADLVVASSAKLYEKALTFNESTILVRNGTDFEMFHTLFPNGKLDSMKKPIIGYHGAISEWFDPQVVARCAEKHPEWNFVLIGSTFGCEVNGLKKLPNVHLLGEMPYKDLPGYLYYFDVCIIPFRVVPLTMATNPVKFYEYISSGKPVVSVRLPEMEQYAEICYLYDGDAEFEKGILTALSETDEALVAKRIEMARNSSWDQRFLDISQHLKDMEQGSGQRKRKVLKSTD